MKNIGGLVTAVVAFGIAVVILMALNVQAETTKKISADVGGVKIQVDGVAIDQETILYDGVTYVPMRAVTEIFGHEIKWDDKTNTAVIVTAE